MKQDDEPSTAQAVEALPPAERAAPYRALLDELQRRLDQPPTVPTPGVRPDPLRPDLR